MPRWGAEVPNLKRLCSQHFLQAGLMACSLVVSRVLLWLATVFVRASEPKAMQRIPGTWLESPRVSWPWTVEQLALPGGKEPAALTKPKLRRGAVPRLQAPLWGTGPGLWSSSLCREGKVGTCCVESWGQTGRGKTGEKQQEGEAAADVVSASP
ncbi:hypothetical protein TREES_T100015759 [Tupaia chinensis]|uniref:Uncharacterized protein n=1 Tax=Tupaia chinensis TaxID=246437 RepID=L9L7D4_TUPCH|nr:hypothetical protein TREES_T100015759 [Tupaia chinensis]